MDGRVELVAHVDQPAGIPETEQHEREGHRQHDRVLPWQRPDPAEGTAAAAQARGDLDRGADREDGEQGRQSDERGESRMDELEAGADLRVGEGVMNADRHGHHQEQDEGDPPHGVAVELYFRGHIERRSARPAQNVGRTSVVHDDSDQAQCFARGKVRIAWVR
ncbi:hypothetical protein ES703_99101 [subsurface metagenome]